MRRPAAATWPRTMLVSVDLPIPGEPPSRTSEPATRPPPSTRSSSPMPVSRRSMRSCLTSRNATTGAARAPRWAPTPPIALPREIRGGAASSTSVFHSPQPGHCPCQRASVCAHSEQTWIVVAAAIGYSETRARGRRLRPPWRSYAAMRSSGSTAGAPWRSVDPHQRLEDGGVELEPRVGAQLVDRRVTGHRGAVGAGRRHRAVGVADADDPRGERDRLAAQAVGVAAAVARARGGRARSRRPSASATADAVEHLLAVDRVAADDLPLGVG